MQTRDKGKESEEGEERRDLELENITGNLLIAEYQVDKLRTRLADLVDGFRPETELRFYKASAHVFKHNTNGINYHLELMKLMLTVLKRAELWQAKMISLRDNQDNQLRELEIPCRFDKIPISLIRNIVPLGYPTRFSAH
jgi:hypothetical protein